MNSESLAYASHSFDCVVIFFLLHELPPDVREHTLQEAIRVLSPGGNLLIAEYGENSGRHLLHKLTPYRLTLEALEPFLNDFWHRDLSSQLSEIATRQGKSLQKNAEVKIFDGFYRVTQYCA
jgi:ubiquinone/menaquinone biosynthesis C-methylase UbiE